MITKRVILGLRILRRLVKVKLEFNLEVISRQNKPILKLPARSEN